MGQFQAGKRLSLMEIFQFSNVVAFNGSGIFLLTLW
jgi:hypothetical protein